jgi:putative aldouronate transport system permease protein
MADKNFTPSSGQLMKRVVSCWDLYLMLVLPILWYIIFMYIPMYGVQIAFRDYMPSKGFLGSAWVGLKHFQRFFSSFYFERVLLNTIGINLYALLVGFPMPIIFALMLNEINHIRYKKLVQNVTYLPHFLSAVVVVSILQLLLNPDNGVVNMVIKMLGRDAVNFMAESVFFKHIYVWSGIWENMGWDADLHSGTGRYRSDDV